MKTSTLIVKNQPVQNKFTPHYEHVYIGSHSVDGKLEVWVCERESGRMTKLPMYDVSSGVGHDNPYYHFAWGDMSIETLKLAYAILRDYFGESLEANGVKPGIAHRIVRSYMEWFALDFLSRLSWETVGTWKLRACEIQRWVANFNQRKKETAGYIYSPRMDVLKRS